MSRPQMPCWDCVRLRPFPDGIRNWLLLKIIEEWPRTRSVLRRRTRHEFIVFSLFGVRGVTVSGNIGGGSDVHWMGKQMMIAAASQCHRRVGLDALVAQMVDTGFAMRYRRVPILRERGGHVSPSVLAMQPLRSRYVRTWRRHARRCADCATVFRYLGFPLR